MTVQIAKKLTLTINSVLTNDTVAIDHFPDSQYCPQHPGDAELCNNIRTIPGRKVVQATIGCDAQGNATIVLELAPPEFEDPQPPAP